MKLQSIVVTLLLTVALAYYIYIPALPDAIQEPWKLMLLDAGFRTFTHVVRLEESVGMLLNVGLLTKYVCEPPDVSAAGVHYCRRAVN